MARSFTNTTENDVLNALFGTPSYTAHPANLVLRLSTTLPTDAGVITEPSGGAYVEQAITFGAASSGAVANTNTVTFPAATGPWGKIVGWAVRDTVAGLTLATGFMGTFFDWVYFADDPGDFIDVVGASAPANDTRVFFSSLDSDGAAPTGSTSFPAGSAFEFSLQDYWVVNNGISGADSFQIAATRGGAPLNISTGSYGGIQIWASKLVTVALGDQLVFAPGSITISLK